jgi:hypothetical protein
MSQSDADEFYRHDSAILLLCTSFQGPDMKTGHGHCERGQNVGSFRGGSSFW